MHLNRLFAAAAAALIACPALAQTANDAPASPVAPRPAAAAPAPALASIPKITPGATIYDTLQASGQFTILVKAIDTTNLKSVLTSYPNLTFLAPTDAAFNALPPDQLVKLMSGGDAAANQLQQILKYYIINAPVDAAKIKGAKGPVTTVEGKAVQLDGSNPDDLLADNADIIQADVHSANGGLIQVLDKVIVPADSPYYPALGPAPTPPAAAAPASTAPAGS